MKKVLFIFLILLYNVCCYTNFTGIEICTLYRNYSSIYGSYGEMGVASPTNFPGARYSIQGTYSKNTNALWIFGGVGFSESGTGMK